MYLYLYLSLSFVVIIRQSTYLPGRVSATAAICVHPFCHNKERTSAREFPDEAYFYITVRLSSTAFLADRSLLASLVLFLRSRRCVSLIVSVGRHRCQTHRDPFVVRSTVSVTLIMSLTHTHTHAHTHHTQSSSRSAEHRPLVRLLSRAGGALKRPPSVAHR